MSLTAKLKDWLAETHGTGFELVRHFARRFFDSDLVTEPGQWTKVMVTGFALLAPAFLLMAQVLNGKYRYFSRLNSPGPYLTAVRADELWLITLTMSLVGLVTAVQWHSLFPGRRDYLALGTLPVKTGEIFLAKFLALLLLVSALILTLNTLPSLLFPVVSVSRWQINPSLPAHLAVHFAVCVLGCYFSFFSLLAIQGVLLIVFRPAWFARITSALQGLAITLMLAGIVLSFSIGPANGRTLLQPELARWLPPVWLLGLYQHWLGDPDPFFGQLADRAAAGFWVAVATAMFTYLVSYRRHRELAVEGLPRTPGDGKWGGRVLDLLVPDPKQQAVTAFLGKTLARSGQHRVVLVGYFGFALALVLTGIAGMPAIMKPGQVLMASFVYSHMLLLLFLGVGLRQVFEIPSELRANWSFQVTEREGREAWLRAVDRFGTIPVLLAVIGVPLPFELRLLGWRGGAEALLLAAAYLALYEWLFSGWQKLPFTCSYLPGKENGFVTVTRFFALLSILSLVHLFLLACLEKWGMFVFVLALLLILRTMMRRSRQDSWSYTPLRFVEEPEPAVRSLNLGTV